MTHEFVRDSRISPVLSANAGRQAGAGNRSVFTETIESGTLDNMPGRLCRLVRTKETGADQSLEGPGSWFQIDKPYGRRISIRTGGLYGITVPLIQEF